ncbi:MAG TPA: hypothetical protein VFT27_04330 [Actinomycetota bacterium]|nr:hypothetical protein [Actinomycetota bacterium]
MRTALSAVGYLLLAVMVWSVLATVLVEIGGKRDRLERVVIPAIQAAHPEYALGSGGCCTVTGILSLKGDFDLVLRSPAVEESIVQIQPTIDTFGRVDLDSAYVAQTPMSYLMGGSAIPASTERKVLEQLPPGMNASAVVLFDHPIDEPEVQALLASMSSDVALLYDVPQSARTGGGPTHIPDRIGWPSEGLWLPPDVVDQTFAGWTATLSTGDDETLRRVGLPSSTALRQMASQGVSGVVIGSARVSDLLSLLEDPLVQTVMPASVEFSLPGTDI